MISIKIIFEEVNNKYLCNILEIRVLFRAEKLNIAQPKLIFLTRRVTKGQRELPPPHRGQHFRIVYGGF